MATKQPVKKKSVKTSVASAARTAATKAKNARAAQKGSGFMTFIREQGVVGLAVGLAIGAAAGDTVKQLVGAFIDPLVQLLVGSQAGLKAAEFTVKIGDREGTFTWGAFVSSLITLVAVAFVVYFIVKGLKLDKLDKKKD